MTGEEVLKITRAALGACSNDEDCAHCPLAVDENDTECANYLVKLILEADVSDCVMRPWGLMERRYADAVQPE
ncbi:hypothetical protein [uncultured Slackia sp.]|uniref:hypothetical protein n=1 Tax=uncultured Slackia sp. TaxID=665903 RepID=UPI0026DFBC46|nr:hypothetical protein [uncultured Slackia sp.]